MISTEAESKKALVKYATCCGAMRSAAISGTMYEMELMDRLST